MYADHLLRPCYEQTMALVGPLAPFDAHPHIGVDDPGTFKCTAPQLLAALKTTGSRAVVFPMHEPSGYPPRTITSSRPRRRPADGSSRSAA